MADATAKKLLQLLGPDHAAELRSAAALVLGEIGGRDAELTQTLCETLNDPEPAVRTQAMTAVGKLRIERALSPLLNRIREGGPESAVAAQAAARLGAKGIRALQELMGDVAPGLRRRIAAALAAAGTPAAETAAVDVLLDSDPGVVDAAARSLIAEVPALDDRKRRALADHLLKLLGSKKKPKLSLASEAALLRLLAAVGDSRGSSLFWARTEPSYPPVVRATALQALGALPAPADASAIKRLLQCAADADFRVAAPAMLILRNVAVNSRNWRDWLPLFDAPDVAVRRFAIEKLAGQDHSDLAAALLRQLRHPDRALRDEAVASLIRLDSGREALAAELLEAETPEAVWALARIQAPLARDYPARLRERVFHCACEFLERSDRRADALLFLLREVDAKDVRDRLADRALAWRKKKQYEKALIYLRLLGRDPACGEALRFELALCGLKASNHDLAGESRAADPALQQFGRLVHSHEVDPLTRLQQSKWLAPEDLFYLGFHFVEASGAERNFGGEILHLLIKRSPRSKLAKDAKRKLRSEGLD